MEGDSRFVKSFSKITRLLVQFKFQNTNEDTIELQNFTSDFAIYLDDENELTVDSVKMQNILGQGAFGLVRKAIITMGDREETVAVKMLRSIYLDPSMDDFHPL